MLRQWKSSCDFRNDKKHADYVFIFLIQTKAGQRLDAHTQISIIMFPLHKDGKNEPPKKKKGARKESKVETLTLRDGRTFVPRKARTCVKGYGHNFRSFVCLHTRR